MKKLTFLLFSLLFLKSFAFSQIPFPNNQPRIQDGPWNHQIHFATSTDGVNWKVEENPIMKEASVPDIIVLSGKGKVGQKGAIFVYTVDARPMKANRFENLSLLISTDNGKKWTEPQTIKVEGIKETNAAPVDPSIVQLEDGRIRLYFYAMKKMMPQTNSTNKFYSAISEDGINFKVEDGVRFESPNITDPEVVFVNNEWLMFISNGQESWLARSKDGLNFTRDEKVKFSGGGVPGALATSNGLVRVYLCGRGGIVSVLFDPKTNEIKNDSGFRENRAADPSIYPKPDGGYAVILKKWTNPPNVQSGANPLFQPKFFRIGDLNQDGRLSKDELKKLIEQFNELDENKDGMLDMRELMGPPQNENRLP